MLRWPAAAEVLERSACWAAEQKRCHPDLLAVGVLGSYTASPSSPPCPSGTRCLLAASIQSIQTFVSTRTPAVPSCLARLVRATKRGSIGRFVAANEVHHFVGTELSELCIEAAACFRCCFHQLG